MSEATLTAAPVSADEFQALEQKVLRAIDLLKREREARAQAETEAAALRHQLAEHEAAATAAQAELATARHQSAEHEAAASAAHTELSTLTREREAVRQRVEKMLHQMDDLL